MALETDSLICRTLLPAVVCSLMFFCALPACAQDLEGLLRPLQSGDPEQKRTALAEIRNIHSEQASRIAVPSLGDPNEMVRAVAASAVVYLPAADAVNALVPLLSDKSEFVRKEAAYALAAVAHPLAAPPLIRLIEREKSLEVRSSAVIALGASGSVTAVEHLVRILLSKVREDAEFMRRSAARSLGQIAQIARTGNARVLTPENFLPEKFKTIPGDNTDLTVNNTVFADAVSVLSRVLLNRDESDDTRREAAFALGSIGSRSSIALLERTKDSTDPYLAEISKEALLKIRKSE